MLVLLLSIFSCWSSPAKTVSNRDLTLNFTSPADTLIIPGYDSLDKRVLRLNRVLIIGNKVTYDRIISRELSLKPGDTISAKNLKAVLLRDKNKIYNLKLFNTVALRTLEMPQNQIDLLVEVSERWYTFPAPIFELSDRNFNEWWQNYGHDFSRVNYGLRLYQYNFRGRNETLQLTAQFGFTRFLNLSYRIPYIDRQQKHGLTFNFLYSEPKNAAYFTNNHKLEFLSLPRTVRITRGASVEYTFRKSFYETHSFGIDLRSSSVTDTIPLLNPNYYRNGSKSQYLAALSYSFNSEHRDVIQYTLKGYQFTGFISKSGLGIGDDVNQFEVNLTYAKHIDLKKGFYFSNFSSAYVSTPTNQAYANYSALGYRKLLVRGYEVYVIEGPNFFLNKTTLKKKIFSRNWRIESMPLEQFRYFPIAIYLKTYLDLGYVENYPLYRQSEINNTFSDRLLSGVGTGIDFVTVYDTVLRFEYSFTRGGTQGFFFNIKKEF